MYCEKCGSELQEGAQFCTSCGEMVTCPPKSETTPDDPTVETFDEAEKPLNNDQELVKVKKTHTIRKKTIVLIAAISTVLVAGIVALLIFNRPVNRMNREIADNRLEEAYEIFQEKFDGQSLPESTVKALKESLDDHVNCIDNVGYTSGGWEYNGGSRIVHLDEADVDEYMEYILRFAQCDDELKAYANNALATFDMYCEYVELSESARTAETEAGRNGNWAKVINLWERALSINPNGEAENLDNAKEQYRTYALTESEEFIQQGDFDQAITALLNVQKYYPNDEEITDKLNDVYTAKADSVVQQYIDKGDEWFDAQKYVDAMYYYELAVDADETSGAAQDALKKAKDAYRAQVLSQSRKYIEQRNYTSAQEVLEEGLSNLPNDEELASQLNGLADRQISDIIADANTLAEGGDWDGALDTLQKAQEENPNNDKINHAYDDLLERMPITLKNITTISSDRIAVTTGVIKDRYGNIYDGGVLYEASYNDSYPAFGLYNLADKFTKFVATAFVSENTKNGLVFSISIYMDEQLVYFKDKITNETAPTEIELDVTGGQTLRIVVKSTDYRGQIYFGNSSFVKANQDTSEPTTSSDSAEN